MVGKSEMKSPQQNKGNGEKEEKSKDIKQEENRGQRSRERENGPYPHQGRGHRGGRGGHFGGPGARAEGGPRGTGGRDRGERGQYNADQAQVSLEDALPPADKKFTGRCRLFVGNLPTDTSEEEFKKMFEPFGESTEVFLNAARGFGFIRMDYRKNADAAKAALDGTVKKGRTLRVRFATHGAALKVKYLGPHVTNELLAQAFSIFGELERAVVIVDDRGKPTGEGIVEFARKPGAQSALKRISEGVFMLGASPKPITVEPLEQRDEEDGYPEKFLQKSADLQREREQPPRFAPPGSFEFDFGQKWKEVYTMHEEQQRNLKRQFEEAIAKLEIEQAGAMMEHQTNMLRQDLLRRQEELRRLEELHQIELQKRMERVQRGFDRRPDEDRRMMDDDRRRTEMDARRPQDDRRQQDLFVQQERAMREMRGDRGGNTAGHGNAPPMQPPPAPPTGMGLDRGGRPGGKGMPNHGGMGGNHGNMGGSHGGMGAGNQGGMGAGNQGGNFGDAPTLRQSRFDQPPGFTQGPGGMAPGNGNMGGGMGANIMGMGRGGGNNMSQQERMMSDRPMPDRQGRGGDRNMREDYFEAKRPRRY